MVGHDVLQPTHSPLFQRPANSPQLRHGAYVGVDALRVDTVVTVGAAGRSSQRGRGVERGHAQFMEVRKPLFEVGKRKFFVQLHAVSSNRIIHSVEVPLLNPLPCQMVLPTYRAKPPPKPPVS